MTRSLSRIAAAAALLASCSVAATPALAASLPAPASTAAPVSVGGWKPADDTVQDRRWDRSGWYPYYGRYHRHHDGLDAGDVLAGVLILGGIAAIASAASNADRARDERYRDYRNDSNRNDDYRYRDDSYRDRDSEADRYSGGRGIDRAVDMCVQEMERNDRVDSVEGVQRSATGWRVEGYLRDGRSFSCAIDSAGQVRGIDYGRRGAAADGQWDDDAYARARDAQQPAYP